MFDKRTDLRGKVVACHRIIGSERIHLRDGQLYHVQDERDERRGKKPPILCKKREKFRKLLFQNRCAAHGLQSDFSPRAGVSVSSVFVCVPCTGFVVVSIPLFYHFFLI